MRFAAGASLTAMFLAAVASVPATAQTPADGSAPALENPATQTTAVIPQQVRYAGKLPTHSGESVEAVFSIYAAREGGEPLWTETQQVAVGMDGSCVVLLGAVNPAGLPQTVFAGGTARWLGVAVNAAPELERVLLSSVPYAMKTADAESLGGHAAADFVTVKQLEQFAAAISQPAPQLASKQATPAVTPGGTGVAGTVPIWTDPSTLGNSLITEVGSDTGINLNGASPAATLDVGGSADVRGPLALPPQGTATATAGSPSQPFQVSSSAWSTAANGPITQNFTLAANPTSNNSASPGSLLALQFSSANGSPANILSIDNTGFITFAPAQTFPGTIQSVSATAPVTATTTAGAVSLGFNTPVLETALNSVYPQLNASNTFTQPQIMNQGLTVAGPVTVNGTSATFSGSVGAGATIINPSPSALQGFTVNRWQSPYLGVPELEVLSNAGTALVHVRDKFMLVPIDNSLTELYEECGYDFMMCVFADLDQYGTEYVGMSNGNHNPFLEFRDHASNGHWQTGTPRFRMLANGSTYLGGATAIWNSADLGGSILTNGSLGSPYWVGSGDCSTTPSALTCNFASGGLSTLTQASGYFRSPAVAGQWYALTYTVESSTGGSIAATVSTGFASTPVSLALPADPGSQQMVYFQASGNPGNFVIQVTLTRGEKFVLGALSLQPITGSSSPLFVAGPIETSNPSASRTNLGLGTSVTYNVPASGTNAGPNQVVLGSDTRLGSAVRYLNGTCYGSVANSSNGANLQGLGGSPASGACNAGGGNAAGYAYGPLMTRQCTLQNLYVNSVHAGNDASDGVFAVFVEATNTGITCTLGTGNSCNDLSATTGHTYTVKPGQHVWVQGSFDSTAVTVPSAALECQ